ncbi:1-acyl-sn-glycerol-3-phosphate acyltransferase [Polystyrenella longa]|uniref:1-acyl-sn-glycerol-3-phosphate acyltransferase n=2 Tax=Polystyrenella longa TaxID=2528007 RepID=A0A518CGN3_9PLAN|nr:1-acyl-sn-glycerol-3-phosphate acyltransferase [Polystyrenella longa]
MWGFLHVVCTLFCTVWFRLRGYHQEKLPAKGGAILMMNHQSFLDPVLVGTVIRRTISFVARDSLFKAPIIGFILKRVYTMPIRRESATSSTIREAVRRLKHGFLVGLYPEGTRSPDGLVGTFKPGFLSILKRTDAPIIPVGIAGAYEAMPRSSVWIRPKKICVVFGDPISHEEIQAHFDSDQSDKEFVEFLRQRVVECQNEANARRQGKPIPTKTAGT